MAEVDYNAGYDDGFEGRPASPAYENNEVDYLLGHDQGCEDREQVQRAGSSNT